MRGGTSSGVESCDGNFSYGRTREVLISNSVVQCLFPHTGSNEECFEEKRRGSNRTIEGADRSNGTR